MISRASKGQPVTGTMEILFGLVTEHVRYGIPTFSAITKMWKLFTAFFTATLQQTPGHNSAEVPTEIWISFASETPAL